MTYHGRHQVETRIQPARHPTTRDDPQPAQLQPSPPRIALPPLHALLPRITPLPRHALAPPIRPLRQHKRILIHIGAQIEARVVHHVVLLHHVRLLEQLSSARGFLAQDLEFRVVIRVRGCGHALQQACVPEDQAAGADGEEGAFFGGVGFLESRVGGGEAGRFGWVGVVGRGGRAEFGKDGGAAGDNEDVVVVEVVVRGFVVDVRFDGEAGGGSHGGRGRGDGAFEGFGACEGRREVSLGERGRA